MAGKLRRKGKPYDPANPTVHDRKSRDLLRNAMVAGLEVDDPYEQGAKIVVLRSLRDDPLGRLHARNQIDEAQYQGGRAFQEDFETAERGPRAVDPSKEAVDGGRMPEPITEGQRKAVVRLNCAERKLGVDGAALTHDVLVHRRSMAEVAKRRQLHGERWEKYFGMRFHECLNTLAFVYGFAQEDSNKRRVQ